MTDSTHPFDPSGGPQIGWALTCAQCGGSRDADAHRGHVPLDVLPPLSPFKGDMSPVGHHVSTAGSAGGREAA